MPWAPSFPLSAPHHNGDRHSGENCSNEEIKSGCIRNRNRADRRYGSSSSPYADVTATFVYKGKAPAPKPISATGDPVCTALKLESDALVVNAKNGGVRDVIVFPVSTEKDKPLDLSKFDPNAKPVMAEPVLDNKDCQFIPHVVVIKAGQTLKVKNSDKTGHNANFGFMNNAAVNQQILPVASKVGSPQGRARRDASFLR